VELASDQQRRVPTTSIESVKFAGRMEFSVHATVQYCIVHCTVLGVLLASIIAVRARSWYCTFVVQFTPGLYSL